MNKNKHLSLIGAVRFYNRLYKNKKIKPGGPGFQRMKQLERQLRLTRMGLIR